MKKHAKYVPLEFSETELETFVDRLIDRLYREFWSATDNDSGQEEIRSRIEKNVYEALESVLS